MTESSQALNAPAAPVGKPRWFASPARREAAWGWVFIAPWIFGLIVFTGGPIIASLILLVMREVLLLVTIGLGVGVPTARLLVKHISAQLYGIQAAAYR